MRAGGVIPCRFFFNDTATTEIYTLSLHDALPISKIVDTASFDFDKCEIRPERNFFEADIVWQDRKSTRLNSSHQIISYAVFCLKKKTRARPQQPTAQCARSRSPPAPIRPRRAAA